MKVSWLDYGSCDPPHSVSNWQHRDTILESLARDGWDLGKYPALVGYKLNGRTQLLSGSHRYSAAEKLKIKLPVVVHDYALIEDSWGDLEKWRLIMLSGGPNGETK